MPAPMIPIDARGPYGEAIVSVTTPPDPILHMPQLTYYGRASDIPLFQNIITAQIPAQSLLTLEQLQSYAIAGARVAIVIQYDDRTGMPNDEGMVLWVNNEGGEPFLSEAENSIGDTH